MAYVRPVMNINILNTIQLIHTRQCQSHVYYMLAVFLESFVATVASTHPTTNLNQYTMKSSVLVTTYLQGPETASCSALLSGREIFMNDAGGRFCLISALLHRGSLWRKNELVIQLWYRFHGIAVIDTGMIRSPSKPRVDTQGARSSEQVS